MFVTFLGIVGSMLTCKKSRNSVVETTDVEVLLRKFDLHNAPALNDSHQDGNDGQYEQNVNESAQRVGTDHPEEPEN